MKTTFGFSSVLTIGCLALRGFAADGPGVPNVEYTPEQVGAVLSMTDPQKAISATALHRGYLFVPLGADHGGGVGAGAFAFYDVSDPTAPVNIFDSRNDTARYHTSGNLDYVGDWAEVHHLPISGDLMMISERRSGSAGFSIFDAAPLTDDNPATKPRIVSRYSFPNVTGTTNYDGYSFALGWQGRRYVYAPTGAQGLYVIDTTDLANPVQLKHMSRAALGNVTLRAAWPIGNVLILAEGNVQSSFSAKIFDISDPGNPVQTGAFSGPFGYHGFVYGSSFYGGGTPIARHDFTNPTNVVRTDLFANPGFDRPEYGYGKDGALFIGHYPGATKWTLAGNSVISAGRVNSGIVDDHAFLNPLGNLVILCSDHNNNRKMILGVHGTAKDTLAPEPLFTSPSDGATNQNVLSRVGISFSDHVDPVSANSSSIIVRKFSTAEAVTGTYSVMQGIVNFAPDAPLEANTTYDVILTAGGVRDQVGNAVPAETRIARFATGSTLSDYTTKVAATTPVQVNGTADLTVNVTNLSGLTLEHSWNFGDGSTPTAFSTSTTASHTYTQPGNFSVQVSTRIQGQTYAPSVNGVQVVHRAIAANPPVNQSTIVIDPARALVWNVNKDNNSVSSIDTVTNVRTAEIPVGSKPVSLAIGPNDRLWVVNKDSASLSVINRATGQVAATHALPAGSSPHGIVIDAATGFAYVSLEATGRIAKIDTADGSIDATLDVGPWPRGLALDPSREDLWVSRFISPDEGGKLTRIDLGTFTSEAVVALAPVTHPDSLQNGRGIPNYLAAPALSPDLTHGFVPSKKDNIFRGLQRDGQPLTFEHSVRSMAAHLDLATGSENPAWRLDFDNSDIATAAVFSPLGNMVFFATSGSAMIWAVDAYNPSSTYTIAAEGLAPDGMAVSADGTRLYIHNFMDRSVTVFRTKAACGAVCGTAPREAKVTTVATEQLPAQVLLGKQLFYSSNDPRMAQEGYMSCASCHLDGGQDGRTWDFTNFGEGLRNSIDLNGRGVGHGPLHWTANFDEVQDFEGQIRGFAQGGGLMSDAAFHRGSRSLPLGESKAGLSADLDALAAYIASLTTAGRSPHRGSDGALSPAATLGRGIFLQENCASCHGGSSFSDSASFARHDVGTLTAASGKRLGQNLDGLDSPTLRGLWHTAPYLHDGSAATLRDVLVTRNPAGLHGNLSDRNSQEIDQLIAYLQSIDDLETTAPTSATGNAPAVTSPGNQTHPITQSLTLQLAATGTGTLTWEVLSLPPGLSINASGLISGAPSAVGTYNVQVAARDSAGRSATIAFIWSIVDPAARRYVKLVSLSSHNGGLFSSLADFTLLGRDGRPLNREEWTATASSQEISQNNGAANAIDDLTGTIWHTDWSGTAFPHHLTIDLNNYETLSGFTCLPRQDSNSNGRIKNYQLYVSNDGVNWGTPVAQGSFPDSTSLQVVLLDSDGDAFSDHLELAIGTDPYSSASQPPASYAGLGGWWKLDEADGSTAINSAGPGHGTLMDAPTRVTGLIGGALQFNGTSQKVLLPSPGINSNTVTLSAWVKRSGNQSTWAGIAFSRSGSASGFSFGPSNELRYHWNDSQYNFSTGLTVPDNTWTFCALVVEPTKATLYMKPDGGVIQTAVNNVTHAAAAFSGNWSLGQDPAGGRYFKGQLDDARIYTRSLSATEIANAAMVNHAPVFANNPITGGDAAENSAYSGTLAGSATDSDAGSTLSYSKVGGPPWLIVAQDGTLSGTPSNTDLGINDFTVRVTDNTALATDAILRIVVIFPDANSNGILDSWETAQFGNSNAGANQPGDDADNDGLTNLMEYALGTNPMANTPGPAVDIEAIASAKYLRMIVNKNPQATNLTYTVETCGALDDWSTDNTEIEPGPDHQLIVRDTISIGASPRRFIRLRVQVAP